MAMNTGSIANLMQGVMQQLRPEQGSGSPTLSATFQGSGFAMAMAGGKGSGVAERESSPTSTAPAVTPWPKMQIDPQQEMAKLRQSLDQWVQSVLDNSARQFNFSKDEATGTMVTRITNPTNGQLVRQIPPEVSLRVQYWLQKVYGHDPTTQVRAWSFNDWA